MPTVQNVFRRGAAYWWRRTLTWANGAARPITLCLSLRTKDLAVARRRAAALTARSEEVRVNLSERGAREGLTAEQRNAIFQAEMRDYGRTLQHLETAWVTNPRAAAETDLERDIGIYEAVWTAFAKTGMIPAHVDDAYLAHHLPEIEGDYRVAVGQLLRRINLPATVAAETASCLASLGLPAESSDVAAATRIILYARAEAARVHRRGDWVIGASSLPGAHELAAQEVAPASAPSPAAVTLGPSAAAIPEKWRHLNAVEVAELYIAGTPGMFEHRQAGKRAAKQVGEQTLRQIRWAAWLLHQSMNPPGKPERPFWTCTFDDIKTLDRWFDRLPITIGKSSRERLSGASLEAICDRAADRVEEGDLSADAIGLEPVTTNKHLRKLKQVWDFLRGDIPSLPDIAFGKFIVPDLKDEREARDAYTLDQGREIFALPPWTGCASLKERLSPGVLVVHDSLYFVLLIVWYTGVRREEVCKLRLDDIVYEDGLWIMLIRNTVAGRVKNAASVRNIVACDELVRLGFGLYVEALRAAGETALFPELVSQRAGAKKGDVFYGTWWQYIAPQLTGLRRGQALHAARHTFDTELKELEVFPEDRQDAMGHAGKHGEERRYSKAARRRKLKALVDRVPIVTSALPTCTANRLLPAELRVPRPMRTRRV